MASGDHVSLVIATPRKPCVTRSRDVVCQKKLRRFLDQRKSHCLVTSFEIRTIFPNSTIFERGKSRAKSCCHRFSHLSAVRFESTNVTTRINIKLPELEQPRTLIALIKFCCCMNEHVLCSDLRDIRLCSARNNKQCAITCSA